MKKSELCQLIRECIIESNIDNILSKIKYPEGYNPHGNWQCGITVLHATKYLLRNNIKNFKIIQGRIKIHPRSFPKNRYILEFHIWIEFNNGKIFDPSKGQFDTMYGADEIKYFLKTKKLSPIEYIKYRQSLP
jgi:hypothetical protein